MCNLIWKPTALSCNLWTNSSSCTKWLLMIIKIFKWLFTNLDTYNITILEMKWSMTEVHFILIFSFAFTTFYLATNKIYSMCIKVTKDNKIPNGYPLVKNPELNEMGIWGENKKKEIHPLLDWNLFGWNICRYAVRIVSKYLITGFIKISMGGTESITTYASARRRGLFNLRSNSWWPSIHTFPGSVLPSGYVHRAFLAFH